MMRLLVSVRDAAEARTALEAGVDLIDVKEPRHGPLGAACSDVIGRVLGEVGQRRPVSVALGELAGTAAEVAAALRRLDDRPPVYAKLGLAGCGSRTDWRHRSLEVWRSLPAATKPVAVVYADTVRADAPPPLDVLDHAQRGGCAGVLVDTFDKHGASLVELWNKSEIRAFVGQIQRASMLAVLAGRVAAEDLASLADCRPDFVAVRGAVCAPDRAGTIKADKLLHLQSFLRSVTNAS